MPFDWREYLALATTLLAQGSQGYSAEAAERCAVSRAYYAAFCHARDYAQQHLRFAPSGTGADHRNVRQHYQQTGYPQLAADLARLHQWRKTCDYQSTVPNTSLMARQALNTAQSIVSQL